MNPEENRRICVVCNESTPAFIHVVSENSFSRLLCTDCLLKEHRQLFCPICFKLFGPSTNSPEERIVCLSCPSIAHLSCCPSPPSSSAASSSSAPPASNFTCPICSDPNHIFYPKSPTTEDVIDKPLELDAARALVSACRIAVASTKTAAIHLKHEAMKKISHAQMSKFRALKAMENLQDLVLRQKASENVTPTKRKIDDR